jgi:hypothetical protein
MKGLMEKEKSNQTAYLDNTLFQGNLAKYVNQQHVLEKVSRFKLVYLEKTESQTLGTEQLSVAPPLPLQILVCIWSVWQ